jgi:hypothetical protein
MFQDSAAGMGSYTIARRLNAARTPTFGGSRGWRSSTVAKFLASRAVLGEFQPHRVVKRKQLPEGEPIKNYFPPIISEQLFYRAHAAKSVRRVRGAGRKGPNISNLFSGLAKCFYCKSAMAFDNKGPGPKGGTYLSCDGAKHGLACERQAWRYDDLEASILSFVRELDLESLIRADSDDQRRMQVEKELAALRGELATVQDHRDRTFELFKKADLATDYVGHKLNEFEERRIALVEELATKEKERDQLSSELSGFYESKDQIKELLERLQGSTREDVYKLRAQIAARLKSLVCEISVAPLGSAPITRKTLGVLKEQEPPQRNDELIHGFEQRLKQEHEHRRFFLITFKDKSCRAVYPKRDDPLDFEEQMVGSEAQGLITISADGKERKGFSKLPLPENWYL